MEKDKDGKQIIQSENGTFMEMNVSVIKGYVKPGSNDDDMKDYTDDVLFKRLMKLQDSKTKVERNKQKKDFYQAITDYNIDNNCKITKEGDDWKAKNSMFSSKKHNDDFIEYFA